MAYQLHEPFHDFVAPGIVFQRKHANSITCDLYTFIGERLEEEVADTYGFNAEQHQSITRDLREAIAFKMVGSVTDKSNVDDSEYDKDEADFVIEDSGHAHHEALVSYSVGDSEHEDDIVRRVREVLEVIWKEAKKYWEELVEGKYEWSGIGKQLLEKGLVK